MRAQNPAVPRPMPAQSFSRRPHSSLPRSFGRGCSLWLAWSRPCDHSKLPQEQRMGGVLPILPSVHGAEGDTDPAGELLLCQVETRSEAANQLRGILAPLSHMPGLARSICYSKCDPTSLEDRSSGV